MFGLMIASVFFPLFYIFYRYDFINILKSLFIIPDIGGFEDTNELDDDFTITDIKYVNTLNSTHVSIGENDIPSLKSIINNGKLIVINYTANRDDHMVYYETADIQFPIYKPDELKKLLFIRTVKNVFIIFANSKVDITDFIIMFFGPNNNFHADRQIGLNVQKVIKVGIILEYLTFSNDVLELVKNEKYMVEIEDNMDNILYFVPNDNFEWNPYINYLNENF